ncbi:MAG TPA: tetratricopeptide repeat protein [Candidatus Limnocylindria bacterium]|nr:tetratricopeptide repeat protein [Candidatus Limnocylindria bacterium]
MNAFRKWRMGQMFLFLALGVTWLAVADPAVADRKAAKEKAYLAAKAVVATNTSMEAVAALGRTCFDYADVEDAKDKKASIAQEGIDACEKALQLNASSAVLHYYLAQDLGQLAQTKKLGALKLLRQMEDHWQKALMLDANLEHAGPDRSLGLLYQMAPGWPTSIGNNAKARKHFEHAVELAPDFPENRLFLAEALLKWKEKTKAREALAALKSIWDAAKQKYAGPEWESDWADWTKRRKALESSLGE